MSKLKELLFSNSSRGQTIFKNFSWLFLGQVGSRLFRALIIIYAARILGAGEYGVFSYVLGLAGFFAIFADIGVNPILTKEAAQNPERAKYFFATSFWIKIALLTITALLVILVAPYFSKIEAAKALLPFAALLIAFDGMRELTAALFRAREKMELEALVITATNIAITIFGFIVLKFSQTASAMAITYILSAGTGTLLGAFILRREFGGVFRNFRREFLSPILIMAWPIAIVSFVGIFMMNVDVIMLGYFKSAEEVGLYSAGQKIIQLLYVFPSILAASIYPAFAKFLGENNKQKIRELIERSITASFLIAIPLVVGGVMLAPEIIESLYGGSYGHAALNFRILLVTLLLVFPGYHLSNYILVHNEQKKAVPIVFAASMGNVIFNYFLIPKYGAAGAAAATVAALFLLHGLSWRLAKKINYFEMLPHLPKIAMASVAVGIVSFGLNELGTNVFVNIALCAGLYFGLLYLFKEKTVAEVKNIIMRTPGTGPTPELTHNN